MKLRARVVAALLLCAACGGGCAVFGRRDVAPVRHFTLEGPRGPGEARLRVPRSTAALRLGRVDGDPYLAVYLVFRRSNHELAFHEDWRWTTPPEVSLARSLSRALFEERGVRRLVRGPGLTLDVRLVAFEEQRGVRPSARVGATVRLHDGRVVRWEETLTINRQLGPAEGVTDDAGATVAALDAALSVLVQQIADRVSAELAAEPSLVGPSLGPLRVATGSDPGDARHRPPR